MLKGRSDWWRGDRKLLARVNTVVTHNPVEVVKISVKLVKAQFILNPEENEDAGGQADSQAENVDKGIASVFFEITESDFKIISDHDDTPNNGIFEEDGEGF